MNKAPCVLDLCDSSRATIWHRFNCISRFVQRSLLSGISKQQVLDVSRGPTAVSFGKTARMPTEMAADSIA
jgi:hypothetical protein